LGATYQTGSTFTYNGASAAAHRTAMGLGTGDSPTFGGATFSGSAAFTSTTRPTSAGTGAPSATSLITKADGDKVFFPIEGLFANAYKVPLTNNLGASSGLSVFSISAATDTTSSFTSSVTSGNYATWCSSHARCINSGGQLVLPSGIGLRARILIGTSGLRRAKLLLGGLSGSSVLGSGVLDARGFGVEIEPNASSTGQIRFRIIYRNQSSQTILGDWTEYISNLANTYGIILWFYRLDQQILAAYKISLFGSIAPTNWQSIPSVSITSGDNLQTGVVRMKNFQLATEGSYSNAYAELSDIYETHNIFPNL
jgi:hypothetical protein